MTKVSCPRCHRQILDCRRYPLEPLAEFMRCSVHQAAVWAGLSGDTQQRAKCHGITRQVVDRVASQLKEHPAAIWPEVVDHDIADAQQPCEECGKPFLPTRKGHRFCSDNCSHRRRGRAYLKARYATDPGYREARLEYGRRYKAEARRALNAYAKAYKRANQDRVREYDRQYKEANQDRIRERRRARYLANREVELAKQRIRDAARRKKAA